MARACGCLTLARFASCRLHVLPLTRPSTVADRPALYYLPSITMTKPSGGSNDRKAGYGSTSGNQASSPKGGHGKGGWGALGDDDIPPLDPRDPCYPED